MDQPFDASILLEMMFGAPPLSPSRCRETPGSEVLVMENITGTGGRTGLKDCDVIIRQGEVVGLAGLEGSGQGVFLRLASGLKKAVKGTIQLSGRKMIHQDYHTFKRYGVSFMPASRLEEGLISGLSITEHFALQADQKTLIVRWPEAHRQATERIEDFRIKGLPGSDVEDLSGGNQQRLLLSFLPANPVLLLLENPTRGLDMESVNWVWQNLHRYCHNRTSIVFSSSELDEILMVADRILVFYNGRIIADVDAADTDVPQLGRAIAGRI
jgi:simple sugar transport system ATP-binding protein